MLQASIVLDFTDIYFCFLKDIFSLYFSTLKRTWAFYYSLAFGFSYFKLLFTS